MKSINVKVENQLKALNGIPSGYSFCLRKDCLRAGKCLRSVKLDEYCKEQERESFNIVNPAYCRTDERPCRYYATLDLVPYAVGFQNQYSKMNLIQKDEFKRYVKGAFCKTLFYDMKKGDRIITPREQKIIISLAKEADYDFPENGFDHIFMRPAW